MSFNKNEQLIGSVKEALSYNANTFMIYTGAPQNTDRSIIDAEKTKEAQRIMKENNIDINNIIVHAPYIINLANNTDERMRVFTINFLKNELERCKTLNLKTLVLHPGSHVKMGEEVGIKNIIDGLNEVLTKDTYTNIALETMAGKGTECGYNFEQLKQIYDGVIFNDKIKFCLDTCHMHDSGYDITNFDLLLDKFDKLIGIDKIACIHINDSKNNINDKKDRHENIGFGNIGYNNIINIIYNKRIISVPKILETPYIKTDNGSYPPYKFEIEKIGRAHV